MNNETFVLLCTAQGLQQEDIVKRLDVSLRTVQRWDAGQKPVPAFAQAWITERWHEFLDRIDAFMSEVDDLPAGHEDELSMYGSQKALAEASPDGPTTIREVNAMNRALAVCLGLTDLVPVARVVSVGD